MTMEKFHRTHTSARVLVIESDALLLTAIGGALDINGHKATLARTEDVAQQALENQSIDLIILGIDDLETGCAFAARLRSRPDHTEIPIIFIVPQLSSHWAANLQEQGGVFCILRSMDPHELLELVQKALWMPHIAKRRSSPGPMHTNPDAASDWIKLD